MASRAFATMTSRQRWLTILGVLMALAVIGGTLIALGTTRGFERGYALPAAGSEAQTNPVGPLPPPVGRPAPRIVTPPPVVAVPPVAADQPVIDDDDADRIAGAIARTTVKALRRGEQVHWHKAGEEGYVSVSEPIEDGDRVCRNVTATIVTDAGETPSRAHQWCTDADDEDGDNWAPAQ